MLTLRTLPIRNLRYHQIAYLPVLLGVAIGAAVLAGALIVGDSLRGSLKERADRQVNGVSNAWLGNRLIRTETVDGMPNTLPALMLRGSVYVETATGPGPVIAGVTVIGLTDAGFEHFGLAVPAEGNPINATVSHHLAQQLTATDSSKLRLSVQRLSDVPQSSLLGNRNTDATTATIALTASRILHPGSSMNEFQLTPSPSAPLNLFVPLKALQDEVLISIADRRALSRNPRLIEERTNRVNAAFNFNKNNAEANQEFAQRLNLQDWGLKLRTKRDVPLGKKVRERELPYISVESERMLLEPAVLQTLEETVQELGSTSARTTAYLANDISSGGKSIPYSIVAALPLDAAAPLGPFLPEGKTKLADDEIVLVDWPESPLRGVPVNDAITLQFFRPELEAGAITETATFKLAGRIPLAVPAADPNLTPPFPGITDRLSTNEWNPPFPYDRSRIKPNDIHDTFWQNYRTTPKAYMNRTAGEKLFGSRFGSVTSLRIAPLPGLTVEQSAEKLREAFTKKLEPREAGFVMESTSERLAAASRGGTDFGMLLLMFSFLLIAAALLLVGMLFRLSVDRRAKEVGLLLATGYSPKQVLRLLLLEGLLIAVLGALLGLGGAALYADGMLKVLANLWPDANVQSYLKLHIQPLSLFLGFVSAVLVAGITIWFALRSLLKVPPPLLLRGQTIPSELGAKPAKPMRSLWFGSVCTVIGIVAVVAGGSAPNPDMRAGAFFTGGGLLLLGGLLFFRAWLRRDHRGTIGEQGGLLLFGLRSSTRNATRSLLTAALIAFATFLLVAVESFRKKPGEDFLKESGGSGGFNLIAEADVPLFAAPDSTAARDEMLSELERIYQDTSRASNKAELLQADETALKSLKSLPFRLHGGDDASCLNLYQAGKPRIVGAPDDLYESPFRFAFAQTEAKTDAEKENPWRLLNTPRDDGAIPVIAEMNTVMWQLKTFVGSEIELPDEAGNKVRFRIVGTLQDSIFQSELLISDANFRKLYPRTEGYRLFLMNAPAPEVPNISRIVTNGLRKNGVQIAETTQKVAAYQAVIGAYLTTFQLLGGFGLLLGVVGLGVVILRGVYERTGELALLRSVGYRTRTLQQLVLIENVLLLIVGMGIGLGSATISVLPNLALGASIPWARLVVLLGIVFLAGLVVAVFATMRVARVPLIPALRKE